MSIASSKEISIPRLGFIGWRGMVGSVLMERILSEKDFAGVHVSFFSTSLAGKPAPDVPTEQSSVLHDAHDLTRLSELDIILTAQGGEYSKKILPQLRAAGWNGFWIDAASAFRMEEDTKIVLDPLNREDLITGIKAGVRTFAGANCSTATLLMGLAGLFSAGLIDWVSFMSYQSISGAGAQALGELTEQLGILHKNVPTKPASMLEVAETLTQASLEPTFPQSHIGAPLGANLLPWIDSDLHTGQSREEAKTMDETNKILATKSPIPIDGLCVRVGVLRAHSFGCTVRLHQDLPLEEIASIISQAHPWVKLIPNTRSETLETLTPLNLSSSLDVAVGRLHKSKIDPHLIYAFVITDQLLWGAAEPLRRMLRLLLELQAEIPNLLTASKQAGFVHPTR